MFLKSKERQVRRVDNLAAICEHAFLFSLCALHVLSIPSSLLFTLGEENKLGAPRYSVFSTPCIVYSLSAPHIQLNIK
jgi:hypothetical protein